MKKIVLTLFIFYISLIKPCTAQYTVLLNFNGANGIGPYDKLTLLGGKLYGTTEFGGAHDSGCIFSIDTNGNEYKDLFDFTNKKGYLPYTSLIPIGKMLYGEASKGGKNNKGVIFSIDSNGNNYRVLFDFNGTNGNAPAGYLTLSGSSLYGMTNQGGTNNYGVVFFIDTNGGNYKDLFNFDGTNGGFPLEGRLSLSGKELYGTTSIGGINQEGNIFSLDTNGSNYKDLHDFNGTNDVFPWASLTLSGSKLFGMTSGYPSGNGNIFSIDTNGDNYKDLLDFNGSNGSGPRQGLILSGNILYGATFFGGLKDSGLIFSIDTNGSNYKDLFDFNGTNGAGPDCDLTLSGDVLYGITYDGGTNFDGLIFSLNYKTLAVNTLKLNAGSISIYPNPGNGQFRIHYHAESASVAKGYQPIAEIYNTLGERVFIELLQQVEQDNYAINISDQPPGVYILKFKSNNQIFYSKLIINN